MLTVAWRLMWYSGAWESGPGMLTARTPRRQLLPTGSGSRIN